MRAGGRIRPLAASLALLAGHLLVFAGIPEGSRAAEPPAWNVSAPGFFTSLPDRTVDAADNGVRAVFNLSPGQGVVLEREGRWAADNAATLALEISVSGTNGSSKDYVPGDAAFPAAVTVVFGNDSAGRRFGDLLYDFFTGPWYGLFSRGIRLTYAWGSDAPVQSMYRLVEDETVFILGGPDETGKAVTAVRRLRDDFEAAYARPPKGPVTAVIVRAIRPSADKGAITSRVSVGLPPGR